MGARYRCFDSLGVHPGVTRPPIKIGDVTTGYPNDLRTRPSDQGGEYVLSLPPGEYEAEDADDSMEIYRIDVEGEGARQLVAVVPPGNYRLEDDGEGSHLYRVGDDDEQAQPTEGSPAAYSSGQKDHIAALRALNVANAKAHTKVKPVADRDRISRGPTYAEAKLLLPTSRDPEPNRLAAFAAAARRFWAA